MTERAHVSRNAFIVAGTAAVLTFLGLLWLGQAGDRVQPRDRKHFSPEKRVAAAPPTGQTSTDQANPASLTLVDSWTPAPEEFVRLTAAVTLHNSRGKVVKEFPAGKRLRVSKRAGDEITINYLGDEYTIATAATAPLDMGSAVERSKSD